MQLTAVFMACLLALIQVPLTIAAEKPDITEQRPLIEPTTGMILLPVSGGCFRMGTERGNYDERPVHEVCISGFYLGTYEVTQAQWFKVMGSKPSFFDLCGDSCPVEQISWSDAQEFITRLNRLSGKKFRLPTEAEWEYACTEGGRQEVYCGGDGTDGLGWINTNSGGTAHPVGMKKPNSLGLFDMSGNVWEWVSDWKGDYNSGKQNNPSGPDFSSTKMRRGGSWQYGPAQSRATWRSSGYPDDQALDVGFRIAHPME